MELKPRCRDEGAGEGGSFKLYLMELKPYLKPKSFIRYQSFKLYLMELKPPVGGVGRSPRYL